MINPTLKLQAGSLQGHVIRLSLRYQRHDHLSKKRKIAIRKYLQFMVKVLDQWQRPELADGGLPHSYQELSALIDQSDIK